MNKENEIHSCTKPKKKTMGGCIIKTQLYREKNFGNMRGVVMVSKSRRASSHALHTPPPLTLNPVSMEAPFEQGICFDPSLAGSFTSLFHPTLTRRFQAHRSSSYLSHPFATLLPNPSFKKKKNPCPVVHPNLCVCVYTYYFAFCLGVLNERANFIFDGTALVISLR